MLLGLATPRTQARSASKTHPWRPAIRSPLRPRQPSAVLCRQAVTTAHQPSVRTALASAGSTSLNTRQVAGSRHMGWHQPYPASLGQPTQAAGDHPCGAAGSQNSRQSAVQHPPICIHTRWPHRSAKRNAQVTVQSIRRTQKAIRRGHQSSESSPTPCVPPSHGAPRCAWSP